MCCQSSFVLVLLSGIEQKPQDVGFDVGEPGNGADRPVGCRWPMAGDNLGAVNLEGAVRVTEVTQSEEACSIPILFTKTDVYESLLSIMQLQNQTYSGGIGVG